MPFVSQVAVGRREFLSIFGNDYDTPDGTGVRDYIHVMDLAEGHLSAINFMDKKPGVYEVFNLGTGNGYSVLDMVRAMEQASGRKIEYKIAERRPGDIATCYADAVKAKEEVRKYFEERHFMRYEFSNAVRFALSLLATLVADGVGGEVGVG